MRYKRRPFPRTENCFTYSLGLQKKVHFREVGFVLDGVRVFLGGTVEELFRVRQEGAKGEANPDLSDV